MPSTQAVANLQAKLESMSFKEGGESGKDLSEFLWTADEVGSQDQVMDETDKTNK